MHVVLLSSLLRAYSRPRISRDMKIMQIMQQTASQPHLLQSDWFGARYVTQCVDQCWQIGLGIYSTVRCTLHDQSRPWTVVVRSVPQSVMVVHNTSGVWDRPIGLYDLPTLIYTVHTAWHRAQNQSDCQTAWDVVSSEYFRGRCNQRRVLII